MTYRDTIGRLGDDTAQKVLVVVAAWEAGEITEDEAAALIAAIISTSNHRAAAVADLSLSADLTRATGTVVPPVGVTPPRSEIHRLNRAAKTLLEVLPDTPDKEARAARLGRSEPLNAAQDARGEALSRSQVVEGWVRQTSGSKCQLCEWWSRGGRVWPKAHTMPRHKGCRCTQTPVLVERVKPVQH
ncbi:hypothetical protein M3697_02605 [Janibacter melonis]|uniref:hypothetical protein n=1 Tax=Janibacter melonis TaxID=262209 RepID=UPI0020432620|nr:hypothetical protein [Janibacter melonis]MCM3554006.1 hypothetical protein [Janibacter melonis]